jgi:hypothetical protein
MNFLDKMIVNYKTSSMGFLMIIGAITSIIYSLQQDNFIGQVELMTQITAIFAGVGFLVSRDIGVSTEAENGRKDLEDAGERAGK